MSTGESLILIVILGAIVFVVYKIHQKKKWKTVGKFVAILILIGIAISAAVYTYGWYANRPYEATTLGKVSLGMSPVEVSLALGKPDNETTDYKGQKRYIYRDYANSLEYLVSFDDETGATLICSDEYYNEIFGLGVYDDEEKILKKLGDPTKTSVNEQGLIKFISYSQYDVAFGIEKGDVKTTCVTSSGEVTFSEEYKF